MQNRHPDDPEKQDDPEKLPSDGWEDVASRNIGDYLERIAVPGGWLYRQYFAKETTPTCVALVFVPQPP
jgi:hypothetical protein